MAVPRFTRHAVVFTYREQRLGYSKGLALLAQVLLSEWGIYRGVKPRHPRVTCEEYDFQRVCAYSLSFNGHPEQEPSQVGWLRGEGVVDEEQLVGKEEVFALEKFGAAALDPHADSRTFYPKEG